MKKINHYLAFCAIFALLLAGCSKDETSSTQDPDSNSYAELSFEAALNDLVNRAASVNKNHFNQIPDCSSTTPDYVELKISYAGQESDPDDVITIDILFDGTVYFTDYSEDLKIPVDNGGVTVVTLNEFIVYNSEGEKIWIAPISSEEGQFDGYVDNPLPLSIEVRDGTKPYIPVEVLCYDRRMVNEYGYVFFDLENTELINFCIFGNFCPPSGRHYVAAYSVDVWTVDDNDQNVDQLYDGLIREVNENEAGELAADPLCIVLPDRIGEEDRYRIEIRIQDGPNYNANDGELIRTTILSDEEVRTFFDGDDNLEYFHFFEGCDEPDTPPIFDDPRDNKMTYKTCAKALNGSGVVALAAASIEGSTLEVSIIAMNMATGMQHAQHIHGFTEAEPRMLDGGGTTTNAICPPDEADTNDDGIISLVEGVPFYGAPRLFLYESGTTFPTPSGSGTYLYNRTFTLDATQKAALTTLDEKVIVLHGVPGDPSRPVACGELELVE